MRREMRRGFDAETVDYLCWYFVADRNRWFHPDETAMGCFEGIYGDELDDQQADDANGIPDGREDLVEALGWERGYHAAGVSMAAEAIQQLGSYLFTSGYPSREQKRCLVEARAQRHAVESDLELTIPKSRRHLLADHDDESTVTVYGSWVTGYYRTRHESVGAASRFRDRFGAESAVLLSADVVSTNLDRGLGLITTEQRRQEDVDEIQNNLFTEMDDMEVND